MQHWLHYILPLYVAVEMVGLLLHGWRLVSASRQALQAAPLVQHFDVSDLAAQTVC